MCLCIFVYMCIGVNICMYTSMCLCVCVCLVVYGCGSMCVDACLDFIWLRYMCIFGTWFVQCFSFYRTLPELIKQNKTTMDDQPTEQKDGRCTANRRAWQAKQAVESPQQYCWNNVFTREEREACFLFAHRGRGPDFFKAFVVTHRSTFAVKLSTCAFLPTLARYFGLYLEQKKPLRHDELLTNPDDWTVWNANLFMAEYDTVLSIVDMNKKV